MREKILLGYIKIDKVSGYSSDCFKCVECDLWPDTWNEIHRDESCLATGHFILFSCAIKLVA